jgi:hypothetical protein
VRYPRAAHPLARLAVALTLTVTTAAATATSAAALGKPATPGGATNTAATTVAPPAGSACGQTIDVPPKRSLGIGAAPLAIGDSVLYDAAQPLSEYGFHVNAMVCRTIDQGITWLSDHARELPALVVVALGTNGGASAAQLDQLLTVLGPHRIVALVTPHNGTGPSTPALYRAAAARDPYRIELLDWDRKSASHPEWFAPDGIHLGGTAGEVAFARLIASSLLGPSGPSSSSAAPPTQSTTIRPTTPAPPTTPAAPPPRRHPPRSGTADHPLRPSQHSIDTAASAFAAAEAFCFSLAGG